MLTAEEVEQEFAFVLEEVVRLARLGREAFKELEGLDFLLRIERPDKTGFFIGPAANKRLLRLTERALEHSAHFRRVDIERAFEAVKAGFGEIYLDPAFEGSSAVTDREHLMSWLDRAGERRTRRTHYIPCQIGLDNDHQFVVGPVTLRSAAAVVADLMPKLELWATAADDKENAFRRMSLESWNSYADSFLDIAEVTVGDCDPETSKTVAGEAVQAALAYIHVMAGARYTRKMRGGGAAVSDRQASVVLLEDGTISVGWSRQWGGAHLEKEFWEWLADGEAQEHTSAVGSALQGLVDRTEVQFIAARFLDAAAWYADAAKEVRPTAAIVKFLTAMERLLWTGEEGGVTKRLSERAAALCFSIENWDFAECRDRVKKAYGLRSEIVHGRITADDPGIMRNYRLCDDVSRDLLIAWIQRYGAGFDEPTDIHRAKIHFDGFVAEVKEEYAKRANAGGDGK